MSGSKSSSKNSTNTTDQRTTNTLNAGLGGDVEGLTAAGNYGDTQIGLTTFEDNSDRSFTDNADNSFRVDMTDSSTQSYADSSFKNTELTDYSDNSLRVDMTDNTGSTNSGNTTSSYSSSSNTSNTSNTNITDGGAFAVVNNLLSKVMDSQTNMINLVGLSSKSALQSANDLAARGIEGAMNIKAGEQVSMSDNNTKAEIAKTVLQVAAVGGAVYLGSRLLK